MTNLKTFLICVLVICAFTLQAQQFNRISNIQPVAEAGWSFGISWVDYNDDGYPDLHISNLIFGSNEAVNILYQNNGNGTYSRNLDRAVVHDGGSVASTWADIDGDGDIDAYIACPEHLNYLYLNNDDGTFTKEDKGIRGSMIETTQDVIWVDYNGDGILDLFVANHNPHANPNIKGCQLYKNTGDSFELQDNTEIGLIQDEGGGSTWFDMNNDGDEDVIWTRNANHPVFFENNGDGTFAPLIDNVITNPPNKYLFNPADFDNDGDLDLFTASYPDPPQLLENFGSGNFQLLNDQEMASDEGFWTGGYWGDYDNDGWIDLYMTAHQMYNPHVNRLYRNNGNGTFSQVESEIVARDSEPSSAAVWADHDLDGDLDLFVSNVNNHNNTLYNNRGNDHAWIQVYLLGEQLNRSALGAKIRIKASINGSTFWQMREIVAHHGCFAQGPLTAHFGLGDAQVVDSLLIEWPDGEVKILTEVQVRQRLEVNKVSVMSSLPAEGSFKTPVRVYPNPCFDHLTVSTGGYGGRCLVELFNTRGCMVAQLTSNENMINMNLKGLAPGYYICKISIASILQFHKLLKMS